MTPAEDEIIEIEPPARREICGRVAYPGAIVYVIGSYLSLLPPATQDVAYKQRVIDRRAYELLVQTGALFHPDHTGRGAAPMIDNRRAPGA